MDDLKKSINGTICENVRAQIGSGDLVFGRELNGRPPLGIQADFVSEPIRDRLLGNSLFPELAHAISERPLAACNLDSPLQGGNVVALHGRRMYTSILVDVNKNRCFQTDKEICSVLAMATTTRKLTAVPSVPKAKTKAKTQKKFDVGLDGLTVPQRIILLMTENDIGQTQLARMCSEYYATFFPDVPEKVKQQHIFNLTKGQDSSSILPLIAKVFDVNDLWLHFGVGAKERKSS